MKKFLIKNLPLFILDRYWDMKRKKISAELISNWEKKGKPIPPPHAIKQSRIVEYAKKFNLNVLIETGTFRGEMVEAQRRNFKKIYSIELSHELYETALSKFKRFDHIHLIEGDSSEMLKEVMSQINEPCLFWLDGHYSGGDTAKGKLNCPIYGELDTIFSKPFDHVLVIDDANDFNGTLDYPKIEELFAYVISKKSNYKMDIRENIISFYPDKN
jgi:hypothetical protein